MQFVPAITNKFLNRVVGDSQIKSNEKIYLSRTQFSICLKRNYVYFLPRNSATERH
jgi:hypothetical protein